MKNKHKITIRLVAIFVLLQAIQTTIPSFMYYQDFDISNLASYRTLPLIFTGIIMHMLSHGGWGHLFGNLSVGLPCFMYIEARKGSKALLKVFLISGLMALFTQLLAMPPGAVIGASGAIFGCFAYCCMDFGKSRQSKLLASMLFLIYFLPQVMYLANPLASFSNVAFAAHIGGGIAGLILAAQDLV